MSAVAQVYRALPGRLDDLVERTGLERKAVRKALDNMQRREQAKSKGDKVDRVWSVKRSGTPPKGCELPDNNRDEESPQKRGARTRKANLVQKRGYKRRKKKHPGLMMYLDTLEQRIAALEQIIGV